MDDGRFGIVTGEILDVFVGRYAADLRFWLAGRPDEWLAGFGRSA